ncbi:PrgI family protein [Candidatus Kuenenbacteria bacterium]|nr:PrgI family protein [Candidatus Kuenenbacteria bacterium]
MNQFAVPQFISVENKIIGPITTRQFVLFLLAAFLIFICYKLSDFSLFLLEAVIILGTISLFAFYKPNGQLFHIFLIAFIKTLRKPALRIWKKEKLNYKQIKKVVELKKIEPIIIKPSIRQAKLSELTLIVDTGGSYKGEE